MASFVESATLLLKDDASTKIDKVNKSLKDLFRTANRMKNMKINLKVDSASIGKVERLEKAIKALSTASKGMSNRAIGPRIDTASITKANELAAALKRLSTATGTGTGRRVRSPVAAGDVTKVRELASAMKQLDRIMARSGRATGPAQLPIPHVDQSKLANIRTATTTLIRYIKVLRQMPRTGGVLPVPGGGRTRAPVPVTTNTGGAAAGGGFFGGLFGGGGGGGKQGGLGGFMSGLAKATSAVIVFGAATAAVSALLRGITEGTRERDVGETRLRLLSGDDPALMSAARQLTGRVSEGTGGRISQGRLLEQSAELFPDIQNPKNLEVVMAELARAETAMLATGVGAEEASKGAAQFVKAMTSSNLVFDNAGNVLPEFHASMDAFIKSMVAGGQDMDPQKMAAIARNMGALGKTADTVTRQFAFFLGEDVGPKAARALNQNVRQIFGGRITKKSKDALDELGLVGKDGTIKGAKESKNILDWTHTYLLPAFKKAGVDITDAASVQAAVMKLGLSTSGEEAVAAIITQWDEFGRRLAAMDKIDPSQSNLNKILGASITANVDQVSESFISLLGTMTQSFQDQLNPALMAASGALNDLQRFITGGDKPGGGGGPPSKEKTLGIMGALGGAGLGAFGVFKLLGAGISSLLGTGALTAAITANTAAVAANTVAQGGSALGGAAGGAGAGAGAGAGMGWFGKTVAFLGTAGGVVALAVAVKEAGDKLKERIPATDTTAAGVVPARGTIAKWFEGQNPNLAKKGSPVPVPVVVTKPPSRPVDQASLNLAGEVGWLRNLMEKSTSGGKNVGADSGVITGGSGQNTLLGTAAVDNLSAAMTAGSSVIEQAFGIGAQQVSTAGTTAASAMQTGITSGGSSAGATIAAQMIAAASTVGSTIANAVRGAAANIHVNVNNPGGAMPANTGAHVGGPL